LTIRLPAQIPYTGKFGCIVSGFQTNIRDSSEPIMAQTEQFNLHDTYAADYDRQMQVYGCFLPEALFGLCYGAVQPGQRLLDAGIGSGLSAMLFAKAGLQVYGFDFSPAMLEICRMKDIAVDLKQHDLRQTPWPYPPASFDCLVCCGVLHFIADLEAIFVEARRVLRSGGLFAFTTKTPPDKQASPMVDQQTIDNFEIYSHSPEAVAAVGAQAAFEQIKSMKCFVGADPFHLWVFQKNEC
jgi:predicted TPR repeat methyltransferase